ncbi:MAG: GNAT family N-acetyltransferase [Dehalococcoidia bacterium]
MPPDLDLLAIEIDTLWTRDGRGRLVSAANPVPHLVIAEALEGRLVAVGSEVPDELATELVALAGGGPPVFPGERPPGLESCAARAATVLGPVEVRSGPSYVAESAPVAANSTASLITSDGSAPWTHPLDPPPNAGWEAEEWRALLAGELGPWAMSLAEGEIASICFCSRLTGFAAEAGLRTEPEYRRQGHGAAATAAWASLVIATGRHAFYSTSANNTASQRVAASLGLRPIGWLWQVAAPGGEPNESGAR